MAQLKLSLEEKLGTITQLDAEILDLTEDDNLEDKIKEADEFKERIYVSIARLNTRTCTVPAVLPDTTPPPTSAAAITPAAVTTTQALEPLVGTESSTVTLTRTIVTPISAPAVIPTIGVRLSKLTIQPFDGNVIQWTSFWDSAIHQNTGLGRMDKFNYLRSLLKGSVRDAISGLMLTEANYTEAVIIFKPRFGNKQQIISKHNNYYGSSHDR